jgi:hypothetical protein
MKLESSQQTSEKSSNIRFNKNPSTATPAVPCGQTDRQTDKTKIKVAICSFSKNVTTGSGAHVDYAVTPGSRGANLTARLYLTPKVKLSCTPYAWSQNRSHEVRCFYGFCVYHIPSCSFGYFL